MHGATVKIIDLYLHKSVHTRYYLSFAIIHETTGADRRSQTLKQVGHPQKQALEQCTRFSYAQNLETRLAIT